MTIGVIMEPGGLFLILTPIAVVLVAVGLTGLAIIFFRRQYRTSVARQRAVYLERVRSSQGPAMLADFSGRVIETNDKLAELAGPDAVEVEAVLSAVLEGVDAAAVYRLSRASRERGLSIRACRMRRTGEHCQLTVTAPLGNCLIWRIAKEDELHDNLAVPPASPYEAAPFAHLRRGAQGEVIANQLFRQLFGQIPEPVIASLPQTTECRGDLVLLTSRDGRLRSFRAFVQPCGEGADGHSPDLEQEGDELFLYPVVDGGRVSGGIAEVLQSLPVALSQFETDGTLIWSNAQARKILGTHAEPGRRLETMFVPLGQPLRASGAETEERSTSRGQMAQLRGTDTFLQISLTRATINDRETILAVLTDASQLRQLEDQFAQSQKMEAVGKLAGGVAHDFNNVLTAIVGHCDLLLLRKDASHPDYSDLIQITQNANRAAALVRQLLAFSRKQTLNPEVLSVQDVVSETHYLLNRLLGETVALQLEVGPEIWAVRADHQQLEQVLMNLVVNARDAMVGSGTVTVTVRNVTLRPDPSLPEAQRPEGDFVEILVSDTGPGIDPSLLDKVFDPFFTTKSKGEGTGLGLSTVYGIVKQSGGFIFAGNAPEGGACFRILLPRVRQDRVGAPPQSPRLPPAKRDLTGKGSVLLVEDEDPVRAFAARALKLRGYEVAEAATAEEAMKILEDEEFGVDLLVSDVVMPGMDGPTFATLARKMRPGLRLIFVSGYAEESFRKNLTETDFIFLPKPFSLNELTGKVKEALGEVRSG